MADGVVSALIAIAATLAVYAAARAARRRLGWTILHPVLVSIVVLIAALKVLGIDYAAYDRGGRLLSFWLGPAVVALGVPLYRQREEIRRNARALVVSITAGSAVGILSATVTAALLGASPEVIRTLSARSVTTPIAVAVAARMGGIPALAAAVVILSGILGAVVGPPILRAAGVRSRSAFGIALGAAAHGVGTARAVEEGEVEAAGSGLAIGLMGVGTALLAPVLLALLAWIGLLG